MPENTPTAAKAPETKTEAKSRYAVLVRGRVYYLGEKLFERGVPKPVTPDEELHLKKFAVDEVTVEDEFEHQPRQKFKFIDELLDDEPEASGSPPARRRRR